MTGVTKGGVAVSGAPVISTAFEKDEEQQNVRPEDILKDTEQAVDHEHNMTLREGIHKYPLAIFWSIWFSAAVIMEGFDHAFISGFIAFPAFQERYGVRIKAGKYEIPAEIQSAIGNGTQAGEIIGLLVCGLFVQWVGYRWVMIGCLVSMIGFIFIQFFATDIYMYLGAEILLGVPWGAFQTLTTTYAAEVCPDVLRPYLTSLVSMFWSIGYLIGTAVLRGCLTLDGAKAYKIPFALQWIFPIPLAIGIFLAPESPWWLVRKGQFDEATRTLKKLSARSSDDEITNTLSMMIYTNQVEAEMKASASYWSLFKGVERRRTEITAFTYVIQVITSALVGYIIYFLEQAGLPSTTSFDFGCGEYALAIVGVFIAWYLISRVGRRTLLLWGVSFMTITTFIIGFMGIKSTANHPNIAYAIGSILLVQYFVYFMTIGSIIYTIVTEIPSGILRAKSVVVARAVYNLVAIIKGQLNPQMIQVTAWNWGAKMGFFWGGLMLFILIWAYYRVPETKGRTFLEIDILFKNNVKARDFSKARVDVATGTIIEDQV
ncbi:hypothetical protein V500_08208 [Pseudogymnoascus sp. VKM F-4518 (FW-2643)]|nr:hypothetical protein V500_08208 [Pseudogymnoascus sp. VKM F-4518 (FW-2643)]